MKVLHTSITNCFHEAPVRIFDDGSFGAVLVRFQGYTRLSICRTGADTDTAMSWEELQKVKSLCGFGNLDAVEVYPRDSDVVNTGNVRHLYIFEHPLKFAMRVQPGNSAPFEES